MQPHWIIENFVKNKPALELAEAVKAAGYPLLEIVGDYHKSDLNRFGAEISQDENPVLKGWKRYCTIFQGSIQMGKLIRNDISPFCHPVLYSSFDNYKCSSYYSHFGKFLFNDRYAILTLEELKRDLYFWYGIYGREAKLFIRPDSGDKLFAAGLVDIIEFDKFYNDLNDLKHELIIISTPKNIIGEWRVVMSKKGVIDYSLYRFQGQLSLVHAAPPGVLDFCRQLLKVGYYPDSVFCFDICSDSDGNYWLLELTSFSSAGLYACDKPTIVREVSKIALEDFSDFRSFEFTV